MRGEVLRDGARRERKKLFGEGFVAEVDVYFRHCAGLHHHAMHRKGVQQFIPEETAGRDSGGDLACRFATAGSNLFCQTIAQLFSPRIRPFDSDVAERTMKVRATRLRPRHNVFRESPDARSGLNQQERTRLFQALPHFRELARQQPPEHRMDVHARVVIGKAARFGPAVIAMKRMIETLAHVLSKGHGPAAPNAIGQESGKRRIVTRGGHGRLVLALRIPREHLDDVVVEAVVELFLERPCKLRMLDLARPEKKAVWFQGRRFRKVMDFDNDPFGRVNGRKRKQQVLVPSQLRPNFFQGLDHAPEAPGADPTQIRCQARSKTVRASSSKSTK